MGRLAGKVALITGASGYIGSVTAKLFAAEGASLVCADIASEKVEALAEGIRSTGGAATAIVTDVTDEVQVIRMIDHAIATYGRLDVLHNNAAGGSGLGADGSVVDTPDAEWDFILKIHLFSTIWCCRHAIPHMVAGGGGSIINMSSMLYAMGQRDFVATGTAKAAVVALTKYIAASHGKDGIRANAVAPGFAMSPDRVAALPPRMAEIFLDHALTPRLGNALDMANSVVFLASDESAYITGQTLHVDGGFGSHNPAMPQLTAEAGAIQSFVKH